VNFTLNKSRIPPEKLDDPRLANLEKGLLKFMNDDANRLRSCLHEAAHAIYLKRAGAVEVRFYGPVAHYRPETDSFDVGDVGVAGDFGSVPVSCDSLAIARWHAAGGVAKRNLTGDDNSGDETDLRDFYAWATKIGMTQKEIDQHWRQAQIDVATDLRKPAFRQEVWALARSYKQILESGTYETGPTPGELRTRVTTDFGVRHTGIRGGRERL
jgi:hypothetical protein